MSKNNLEGRRRGRSASFLPAVLELLIVAGACLFLIFVIIPWQTVPGGEIGLPPDLVPTACAAAIAVVALLQFAKSLVSGPPADDVPRPPIRHVAALVGMTVLGIAAIRFVGWEIGPAILALGVTFVLGERNRVRLIAIPVCVAGAMFVISHLGI